MASLLHKHSLHEPAERFTLEFASPTAFHKDGLNLPLPVPVQVFGSLLHQWEDLYPEILLPDNLWHFLEYRVALSRYEGKTAVLAMKNNSRQVGFVGQAHFAVVSNSKLKKLDATLAAQLDAEREQLVQALNFLVTFGFYSGVGTKTTMGMGMVRAIAD